MIARPRNGVFTVSRAGPTVVDLTVQYTLGGTASHGNDYQAIPASTTIPAGQSSATVTITPIPDALAEGDETVILTISPNSSYLVGNPGSATVTIADAPNTVTVVATDANASEAGPDPGGADPGR